MKAISIRELHERTGRWVRQAGQRGRIVITERGRPVAALAPLDPVSAGKPLPDREKRIQARSRIDIDSRTSISEMRDRS